MSIHFRSRISNQQVKPTVNTGGSGWCCSTNSVVLNRSQCQGGFFILGGTNSTFCPQTNACISNLIGTQGACCYWKNVNGVYTQTCESVESAIECANKNQGLLDGLYPSFTLNGTCIADGGNVSCNGVKNDNSLVPEPEMLDSTNSKITQKNILGHCCDIANAECKKTIESECGAFWAPPDITGLYSCNTNICDGVISSTSSNIRTPPSIYRSQVDASTNYIKKIPEIGQYYQGGVYIGTFSVATNKESLLYGNRNTGSPSVYSARYGNGGINSLTWILVADDQDLDQELPYNLENETGNSINISYSDGLYNTDTNVETNLIKYIKNYKKQGFQDWYLPSQDELAFYFNNIKLDTNVYKDANLKDGLYLSSTGFELKTKQKISTRYYNYAQDANSSSYGDVSLISRNAPVKIRLFRRIYLIEK